MAEVLLYNIEKTKAVRIKVLCSKMGVAARTVPREDYGVKLSALLGLTDDRAAQPDSDFDAEMLYTADTQSAAQSAQTAKDARRAQGGAHRGQRRLHVL